MQIMICHWGERHISGEIVQWIPRGRHQLVDFGVERHTLVTGKITQVFHHSSATVTQGPAARGLLSTVRVQLLRRFNGSTCPIQGEFRDSPPTQLRGRQGTYFSWFLVKFRWRNHLGCIFQTWKCGTFGGHIWGSRASIRSDSGKPFRPISQ
jgi:hypothetical protein